jgi:hypothetical protein
MVLRYAKDGSPFREPPYTKKEIAEIEGFYGTPIGITRAHARGEAPARPEASPPPPAKSRRAKPGP